MADPQTSDLKARSPTWCMAIPAILAVQAVLVLMCLTACGGGGSEDDALSTAPKTPSVDPRLLIQADSAPAPGASTPAGGGTSNR